MASNGDQSSFNGKFVTIAGDQARLTLHWLTWADNDYVAARRLLLDGLLVQGASLANTAIEKYLKALLVFQNKKVIHGHKPLSVYQEVRRNGSLRLNESFLGLLEQSYEMRYPDDLDDGYNIVLSQALILDALDQTVKTISDRIAFKNGNGDPIKRNLDVLIEKRDPRMVSQNTALGTITKEALLNQASLVFECRILNKNHLGAEYLTEQIKDEAFGREAFVQESDRMFRLAYLPVQSAGDPSSGN